MPNSTAFPPLDSQQIASVKSPIPNQPFNWRQTMSWSNAEKSTNTKEQAHPPQQEDLSRLCNPFQNHLERIETPEASRQLLEGALDVAEFEAVLQGGSPW
ncbi:MAG: hypothetical protein ACK535_13525, partial [Cyanobacteriota bacterium]